MLQALLLSRVYIYIMLRIARKRCYKRCSMKLPENRTSFKKPSDQHIAFLPSLSSGQTRTDESCWEFKPVLTLVWPETLRQSPAARTLVDSRALFESFYLVCPTLNVSRWELKKTLMRANSQQIWFSFGPKAEKNGCSRRLVWPGLYVASRAYFPSTFNFFNSSLHQQL